MGIKTKIAYCDSTVNPIMGCTGCALRKDHCYAAVLCARYAGCKGWPKQFDEPEHFPGRLEKAIGWADLTEAVRHSKPWLDNTPRVIFVNDMSDGFCPDVDARSWLLPHLDAMEESPHTWLLLTKWPLRMQEFFASLGGAPSNFWLGVSIEKPEYSYRANYLRQTPAAIRFISFEPLLASFTDYPGVFDDIDWVIVGGESGPGARPMRPQWARDIRDQCRAAGTPFFFKQIGEWAWPGFAWSDTDWAHPDAHAIDGDGPPRRIGKKAAGRLLDGREWNEIPICESERTRR